MNPLGMFRIETFLMFAGSVVGTRAAELKAG
jgi:hypothetical protein